MIKMLAWLDGANASTGFGTVAKNILSALHASGEFDIHHLAINYHGQFVDRNVIPWQMSPAKLLDPQDPHGCQMFLRNINEGNYDVVFICNDLHVTHLVADGLKKVLAEKRQHGKKVPKIVYYYPVDCHVLSDACGMLDVADQLVAYTNHGIKETLITKPYLAGKIAKIHHGTDINLYRPFSKEIQNELKAKYLRVSPETFVFINVNRNSQRKQMARCIYLFSEFKKKNPNSIMYMHTAPIDTQLNLYVAVKDLGLSLQKDVVFPVNFSPGKGYPEEILNEFYNMADCFITTHLGEGWGLTCTEAMAAGIPVIAPRNTSMPEIFGSNSERGFLYPCKDTIYVDNSGYRPCGLQEDVLDKMQTVYDLWKAGGHKHQLPQVIDARGWVEANSWDVVNQQWMELFANVLAGQPVNKAVGETL